MTDVFVSYARPTAAQAQAMADLLRGHGFGVWRDDDLPPHRPFGDVIEERLREASAVLVMWSADAAKSQWVRAEAEMARESGKLVQLTLDGAPLPLPFNQIQCADLIGWKGNASAPGLHKVLESLSALVGDKPAQAFPASHQPAPASLSGPATVAVRTVGASTPLATELAAELAAAIGRHSALVVRDHDSDGADYVVELQARQAGGRIRATARLLVAADGAQLWSDRFEGSEEDLFDLEDRVTELVTANVEAHVRRARIDQLALAHDTVLDTAEARIMLATKAANRMQRDGYREAIALLQPVFLETPDRTDALALLSLAHANLWYNGHRESGEADRLAAIDYARRTLRLTDSEPFPTGISAVMLASCGEPVELSISFADRVRAFAPGFAPAHLWCGQVRLVAGQLDEAAACLETARRLDQRMSVRAILLGSLGAVRMLQGRQEAAVALLLEAGQLAGEIPMNNVFLAASLGLAGRAEEARKALARAETIAPVADFRLPLSPPHRAYLQQALAELHA